MSLCPRLSAGLQNCRTAERYAVAVVLTARLLSCTPHSPKRGLFSESVNFFDMDDFERRAEQRRGAWQGATVSSHLEMADQDTKFWSSTSGQERLDAVWEMALEAWSLKRGAEPAPRLQGSPVGIRRRRLLQRAKLFGIGEQ